MFQTFKKKSFRQRLKDTGYLMKHSFTVVGKDEDIKKPVIHMAVFSSIILTLFFVAIGFIIFGLIVSGILIILLSIILSFVNVFYKMRQKADQSWIVYNTVIGKDISYRDAHSHTRTQRGKLRLLAFLDIFLKRIGAGHQGKGIIGIIVSIFFAALREVWDLVKHYSVPAVVIEQKSIKELVPKFKSLKNNVPATLAGVFAIDFVGNAIGGLIFLIGLPFLVLSVWAGISFGLFVVPVIVFYIFFLILIIYSTIVGSIKIIYFTIFYTSINRPSEISKDMQEELTHYLKMEEGDFGRKEETPREKYISQLRDYISSYVSSGKSKKEVSVFLIGKGYSKEDVDEALSLL
jgi:hypothetical protein